MRLFLFVAISAAGRNIIEVEQAETLLDAVVAFKRLRPRYRIISVKWESR